MTPHNITSTACTLGNTPLTTLLQTNRSAVYARELSNYIVYGRIGVSLTIPEPLTIL